MFIHLTLTNSTLLYLEYFNYNCSLIKVVFKFQYGLSACFILVAFCIHNLEHLKILLMRE